MSRIPTRPSALRRRIVSCYPVATRPAIALFLALVALNPVIARAQDAAAEKAADKITYDDHVFAIFEDQCLNCHNPDKTKGGLDLATYTASMAGGSSGEIFVAGDPAASRVVLTVTHREEPYMPPEKPIISKDQIEMLTKWIEGGLLENSGSVAKKKKTPDFEMALDAAPAGKPEGPPPMPEQLRLEPYVVASGTTAVADIAPSPWAPLLAVTGQKQVLLYHSDTNRLVGVLPFELGFPETLTFSRNGSLLIAGGGLGGKTGKVFGFDVKTGQKVIEVGSEFDSVLAADISPDHSQVALGGPGKNLKLYDTKTGEQLHSIKKHPDWLLELAYSPDGKFLASGGRTGGLYLWDPAKGLEFYTLKGPQEAITGISWRADSKLLVTSSEDGKLYLWEPKEGKQVKAWDAHPGGALSVHFAMDGKSIVSTGRDKTVKVWDIEGKNLRTIKDFPDLVLHGAFSQDGKRIFSADWSGELSSWNAADGKKLASVSTNPPTIANRIAWHTQRGPELEKELAAAKAAQAKAAQAKTQHDAKVAGTKKSIPDLTAARDGGKKTIAGLQGAIKKLTDEYNGLKGSVASREKKAADLSGQLKQAEQQFASVKSELEKWKKVLQAEQQKAAPTKPAPGPNKTAAIMARAILVVDNAKDEKPAAPAPKPEPKKEEPKPAPKPEPKKEEPKPAPKPEPKKEEPKPAPKPEPKKEEPKPAPKPEPKKEEPKPAPKPEPKKEEPKPAPKPEPKKEAPKPAPKPEPKKEEPKPAPKPEPKKEEPKPAPAPSPQQKVTQLTEALKSAESKVKQLKSADAKSREELAAEKTKRDTKQKELAAQQKKLADTQKALQDAEAKLKPLPEALKKLEEGTKAVHDGAAAAAAKTESVTRSIAANSRDLVVWKAEQFHLGVFAERDRLEEMKFELPEKANDEQLAAVEYQEKKVASLTKQYLGLLPK